MKPRLLILMLLFIVDSWRVVSQNNFIEHSYPKYAYFGLDYDFRFIDFNSDGNLDLINFLGTDIDVLHFNPSGIDSIVSTKISHADLAGGDPLLYDWNNDGLIDLLSWNWAGSNFGVKYNLNNYEFTPTEYIFSSTAALSVAHVNNDMFPDLFARNTSTIFLHINELGGSQITTYSVPSSTYLPNETSIVFTDINGNGLKEMFVRNQTNKIYIYAQTGSYDYQLEDSIVSSNIGFPPNDALSTIDLDNDGVEELVVVNGTNFTIFKRSNGYQFNLEYTGNYYYEVNDGFGVSAFNGINEFYDVDQNGFIDIIAGNYVFFNNGSLSFNKVQINSSPKLSNANYRCADIDGNGQIDICSVYRAGTNTHTDAFMKVEYAGNQSFGPLELIWYIWPYNGQFINSDNDGLPELFNYNLGKSALWDVVDDTLYPNHAGAGFSYWVDDVHAVDLNNDGLDDLLAQSANISGETHSYKINLGNGSFSNNTIFHTGLIRYLGVEDIDGDGYPELFYHRMGGMNGYIDMYSLLTGAPVLIGTIYSFSDFSIEDVKIRFGDFDLDGHKDIIVNYQTTSAGKIRVVRNNGDNTFSEHSAYTCACEIIGLFDSNGDYLPDIHYHNGLNRILRRVNNNGNFNNQEIIYTHGSNIFSSFSVGSGVDLDNDGYVDIIVQGESRQTVFRNTGAQLEFQYTTPTGILNGTRFRRIIDIDNDGDFDILADNVWYENVTINPFRSKGTVFYDLNGNGNYEQNIDFLFPNFPIQLGNGSYVSYTDSFGNFEIPLGSQEGSYNVYVQNSMLSTFIPTTNHPAIAEVTNNYPLDSISIGVQNIVSEVDGLFDIAMSGHRCNEPSRIFLSLQNKYPENVNAEIKLVLPNNIQFVSSNFMENEQGDTIIWQINDLSPFQNVVFYADVLMPDVSFMNDTLFIQGSLILNGSLGELTIEEEVSQVLTCAYDPNDKQITDLNYKMSVDNVMYSFNDLIEYTIRFQNTGNDTAKTVVIEDNLSSLFDFNSVKPISGSSSYNFTIDSTGLITVVFEDINLPDSTTDFLGSIGYIKFSVNYDTLSTRLMPVYNQARIYFDQNPPIFTNYNQFKRVDCEDLFNINSSYLEQCFDDSLFVVNDDLGFPMFYEWTLNDSIVGVSKNLSLTFPNHGLYDVDVLLRNEYCAIDTSITINVLEKPNIELSWIDSTVCSSFWVSIQSNITVDWWKSNDLTITNGNSFLLTVDNESFDVYATTTNSIGCSDTVVAHLTVQEIPNFMNEWQTSISAPSSNNNIYFCSDTIVDINSNYGESLMSLDILPQWDQFSVVDSVFSFEIQEGYTYQFVQRVLYEGCYFQSVLIFVVDHEIPIILDGDIEINGSINHCDMDSVFVSSINNLEWYKDDQLIHFGNSFSITESGSYSVSNECNDPVVFDVNMGSTSSVQEVIPICLGANFTFPDGVVETEIYEEISHVSYLISSAGCDSVVTTNLVFSDTVIYSVLEIDNGLQINASNSLFQWLDCDNNFEPIINENGASYFPSEPGNYTVVINQFQCVDTIDCYYVDLLDIENLSNSEKITLFPNPTSDWVTIDLGSVAEEMWMTVISADGKIIIESEIHDVKEFMLNFSSFNSGVYTLNLIDNTSNQTFKVVKF